MPKNNDDTLVDYWHKLSPQETAWLKAFNVAERTPPNPEVALCHPKQVSHTDSGYIKFIIRQFLYKTQIVTLLHGDK